MTLRHLLASAVLAAATSLTAAATPTFEFVETGLPKSGDVVVYVAENLALRGTAAELDAAQDGALERAIELTGFTGTFGETILLNAFGPYSTVAVIGAGDEPLDARGLHDLGGYAAMATDALEPIAILADDISTYFIQAPAAHIAAGFALGDYNFTDYRTVGDDIPVDANVSLYGTSPADAEAFESDLTHLIEGVTLARDFGSEPGNRLWPAEFVKRVQDAASGTPNLSTRVLDASEIEAFGMGALHGSGKGSIHDPRLLVLQYNGGRPGDAPLALVGKGVTFDTGGISIKRNQGMWLMKSDLSGAAAVAGTVIAAAKRGEEINLVGVMPLTENMPSQDAIRPGDVLTTMSGKTIEIMSTDAEGRLLLADAVHFAQVEYDPYMLLNIATLTGSAARAMGDDYGAVITRDIDLSLEMMKIGELAGEDVWPLPLNDSHFVQIESLIADIKNTAGAPGASIGAAVVGTFVDPGLPWVHLDIAGVDWREEPTPTAPIGHAGWGVRFMDQLVRSESEK